MFNYKKNEINRILYYCNNNSKTVLYYCSTVTNCNTSNIILQYSVVT